MPKVFQVNNGSEVFKYELRYASAPSMLGAVSVPGLMKCRPNRGSGPDIYEYAVTGLTSWGPIYFSTRATNDIGASDWSDPSSVQTVHREEPARMAAPTLVDAVDCNTLLIAYVPPADLGIQRAGGVLEYQLRYTRRPELFQDPDAGVLVTAAGRPVQAPVLMQRWDPPPHSSVGHAPPVFAKGLLTGRTYYFQVRAQSAHGVGAWSEMSEGFSTTASKPEAPARLEMPSCAESSFHLALKMTLPEANGCPIHSVRLRMLGPNWHGEPPATEWKDYAELVEDDCVTEDLRTPELDWDASEPGIVHIWRWTARQLHAGAAYRFRFQCVNGMGTSEWSEPSEEVRTLPTVPDQLEPPYCPSEEDKGSTWIRLCWDRQHDGGSDIRFYTLMWALNPKFHPHHIVDDLKEAAYTVEGLEPNVKYYFKVAANNDIGRGKFSDFNIDDNRGLVCTNPRLPGPCQELRGGPWGICPGSAHITWHKPADDGGCMIQRYNVTVAESEDLQQERREIVVKTFRELKLTDLKPEATYYFEIEAVNAVGIGPPTGTPIQVTTKGVPPHQVIGPRTPSAPVLGCVPGEGKSAKIQVRWNVPEIFDPKRGFMYIQDKQTHMITHYSIKFMGGFPATSLDQEFVQIDDFHQIRDRRTVPKNEKNVCEFDKILPGHFYCAQVKAYSEVGESDWSAASEVVRAPAFVPDIVPVLNCTGVTPTSFSLQWESTEGNGEEVNAFVLRVKEERVLRGWAAGSPAAPGAGIEGSYEEVQRWLDEELLSFQSVVLDSDLECSMHGGLQLAKEISGLQPASFYYAEVCAVNNVGRGPFKLSGRVRTASTLPGPPSRCRGLLAMATTESVRFEWDAPTYDGGEDILGYEVRWIRVASGQPPPTTLEAFLAEDGPAIAGRLGPHDLRFHAQGLLPADLALPVVRAFNAIGHSPWSLPPQGEEEISAFACLPDKPKELLEKPVIERRAASDHRLYGLRVGWQVPDCCGRPISKFSIRICLAGPGTGEGVPELPEDHQKEHLFELLKPAWRNWGMGEQVYLDEDLHKGLVPGFPYIAYVRATSEIGDAEGWGQASDPELAPPDFPEQPAPPFKKASWPNAIEVGWKPGWMRGLPVSDFEMKMCSHSHFRDAVQIPREKELQSIQSREVSMGDLAPGTSYYFACRVKNEIGWSDWSYPSNALFTGSCRPARPEMPELMEALVDSVRISWTPPKDHGAALTRYDVLFVEPKEVDILEDALSRANHAPDNAACLAIIAAVPPRELVSIEVSQLDDPEHPAISFEGLLGGRVYGAAVCTHNIEGPSDWSLPNLVLRTPPASPATPPPLNLLEATQVSLKVQFRLPFDNGDRIHRVEVAWARVCGPMDHHLSRCGRLPPGMKIPEDQHGEIVMELPEPGLEAAPPYGLGGSGQAFLEGLDAGTEYRMQVRCLNTMGSSDWSDWACFRCSPGKPCTPRRIRHAGQRGENFHSLQSPEQRDSIGTLDDDEDADDSPTHTKAGCPTVFFRRTSMLLESQVLSMSVRRPDRMRNSLATPE